MVANADFWLTQFLNGLQLSMLLFLLSIGLTIIFGLMHFVNLAHGALYMVGAYAGVSAAASLGNYWVALLTAPLAVMLFGIILYVLVIRRMRRAGPMNQVLVTFGLIFVIVDLVRIIWGDIALGMEQPAILSGPAEVLGVLYPAYRLFIIGLGFAVMIALSLVLSRTQIGAMVRAGVENGEMVEALGYRIRRLFLMVFMAGSALAGLGGVMWGLYQETITAHMGQEIMVLVFIVVIIGGLGSVEGCFIGALLVGLLSNYTAFLAPKVALVSTIGLMVVILMWRPQGLYPVVKAK